MFMLDKAVPVAVRQLADVPCPAPTDTWSPIPHAQVVDVLTKRVKEKGLQIRDQHFTVVDGALHPSPGVKVEIKGARLFGKLDLEPIPGVEFPDGCIPSLGDEPRDLMLEFYVAKAIKTKKVSVVRGGPRTGRNAPGPEKLAERKRRAEVVRRIADEIRESVVERTKGVDQHCLRMTHRTWALMAGVPEILIDRQLGHSSPGGEAALRAAWSLVGRSHYTDMNMLAGDARRSAEAVRKMLDRAEAELQELATRGDTALVTRLVAPRAVAVY